MVSPRLTTPLDNLTTPNGLTASMIILILFNPIISAVRSVRQVRWKQLTHCLLTDRRRLSSVMKSQGGAMQPEKKHYSGYGSPQPNAHRTVRFKHVQPA